MQGVRSAFYVVKQQRVHIIRERQTAAEEETHREAEKTLQQDKEKVESQKKLLDFMELRTTTDFSQKHDCKEEEVLADQQHWNQERNLVLDHEKPESPQLKEEHEQPEPPQVKEEQEELCISQEGEQLVVKLEVNTIMAWSKQVRKTRADWKEPTKYSVLCSEHFTMDCFEEGPLRSAEMGIETKRRLVLKKGAVPTIFRKGASTAAAGHLQPSTSTSTSQPEQSQSLTRSAYVKRERKRKIQAILEEHEAVETSRAGSAEEPMEISMAETPIQHAIDRTCQTDKPGTVSMKSQTTKALQIKKQSKACQVTPEMIEQDREGHHSQPPSKPQAVAQPAPSVDPIFLEELPSSSPAEHSSPAAPGLFSSSDWKPSSPYSHTQSSDTSSESDDTSNGLESCHKEPKYIVFSSCLQKLLRWCHCPSCGSVEVRPVWSTSGTVLNITLSCDACDSASKWESQPSIGRYAAGNLLLSAGILFAGATQAKVLKVLQHMGVVTYSSRTFFKHQKDVLEPAILKVWKQQQQEHLTLLQVEGRPLVLGGDGRADSPGHSAKFGTYTTMELKGDVVLDLQIVQSNEVGGSYHMELEGLKRMVAFFDECSGEEAESHLSAERL
ncbi:uncharacterized protein KZ484_010956 [Pholidichthys leucotaenia]